MTLSTESSKTILILEMIKGQQLFNLKINSFTDKEQINSRKLHYNQLFYLKIKLFFMLIR